MHLLLFLSKRYPERLLERFRLDSIEEDPFSLLESIGRTRGMLLKGNEVDTERAAAVLLDEFRSGKLGRITLEFPENENDAL